MKIREFKERKSDLAPNEAVKRPGDDANKSTHLQKPISLLRLPSVEEFNQASGVIIRAVQEESFPKELKTLKGANENCSLDERNREKEKELAKTSQLYRLNPFIDEDGVLRVGGRLRYSSLDGSEKHPIVLPKGHHVSVLLIEHYHAKVCHQGLIGAHRMVAKVISSCVICRKLRGRTLQQHMADLPEERTSPSPPFTYVGFDVFGPWQICTRKLRGGAANSKRWGSLFTCLNSRAIHIEVLEAMDASAFICALRRFFAIRGPALRLRCDRGTNFVGGKSELEEGFAEMHNQAVQRYLVEQGCEWVFNPPHASHFGGVWERQIGTIRRILDAMLMQIGGQQLTHELLTTLMAEVTGIVNSRPIGIIPSDIEEPQPLTPAMLLTMKTRPLTAPPGEFHPQDMYSRKRWRRSQYLTDQFWLRWRREYIQNLQVRTKWNAQEPNIVEGDVVLVKDNDVHRNHWPLGRVTEAVKSEDGKVRKATVMIHKDGGSKVILRPIKELVKILSSKDI